MTAAEGQTAPLTPDQVRLLPDEALQVIVRSTNPLGGLSEHLRAAEAELATRGMRAALEWIVSARPGWRDAAARAVSALASRTEA